MKRNLSPLLACVATSLFCGSASADPAVATPSGTPGTGAVKASATAGPCASPGFRQFDFWAGHWDVADGAGQAVGRNDITIEEKGCVLVERWTSVAGNTGLSVNFYDPLAGEWTQQWIGLGVLLRMTGRLRDGSMVLEGPSQNLRTGKVTRLRGTWTALPDGRVRQHFEESSDNGRTWQEWFDGYYRRIAAP